MITFSPRAQVWRGVGRLRGARATSLPLRQGWPPPGPERAVRGDRDAGAGVAGCVLVLASGGAWS